MSHEHQEPDHTQWDISSSNPKWRPLAAAVSDLGRRVASPNLVLEVCLYRATAIGGLQITFRGGSEEHMEQELGILELNMK